MCAHPVCVCILKPLTVLVHWINVYTEQCIFYGNVNGVSVQVKKKKVYALMLVVDKPAYVYFVFV